MNLEWMVGMRHQRTLMTLILMSCMPLALCYNWLLLEVGMGDE
jgi:hypothetical protein